LGPPPHRAWPRPVPERWKWRSTSCDAIGHRSGHRPG